MNAQSPSECFPKRASTAGTANEDSDMLLRIPKTMVSKGKQAPAAVNNQTLPNQRNPILSALAGCCVAIGASQPTPPPHRLRTRPSATLAELCTSRRAYAFPCLVLEPDAPLGGASERTLPWEWSMAGQCVCSSAQMAPIPMSILHGGWRRGLCIRTHIVGGNCTVRSASAATSSNII
ncbi:hypothetical protein HYPSUDRAFT_47960 [Hypholoma sublateritium FD-334 SS-4]|uniref:Uncharacterized protein n=1 Tax=Hypholoma sublateritium (strain FD-334 SS-4) TaxID=945553 RepID=A0A0D2NGU6_HYPSF|nr:hypothetical protein HYPSUDRAFT_47960 [Hypholoma sublateritium FD-334 SS-4]